MVYSLKKRRKVGVSFQGLRRLSSSGTDLWDSLAPLAHPLQGQFFVTHYPWNKENGLNSIPFSLLYFSFHLFSFLLIVSLSAFLTF